MKKTLLVFDYDGTIHNTMNIYEPAFKQAQKFLVEKNLIEAEEVPASRIAGWLGLNSKEMWDDYKPELPTEYKELGSKIVGDSMVEAVASHKAVWYEGAAKALDILKQQGYKMVILSNCKTSYRDIHWREFDMGRWFDKFYACQAYDFAPKIDIIKIVLEEYNEAEKVIVIGDRDKDMECAKAVNASFIACMYGFARPGELSGADAYIDDISKLVETVNEL